MDPNPRPFSGVQHQASGVGDVLADQHGAVGTVQLGHLNGLQHVVGPVQVAAHPVHRQALCHRHPAVKYLSMRDLFSVTFTRRVVLCDAA